MNIKQILLRAAIAHPGCANAKVVAAIVRKRILAFGFNNYKTHPLQKQYARNPASLCLHAEIDAIARLGHQAKGADLYVARVLKNGTPAMAKPCQGCVRAIAAFGIRNVYYTTHNGGWNA